MFKQSLSYLTATAFIVAVNFLTLPFFTKFLTLSDYGVLALFVLFGTISTGLLSFGLSLAMYRFYFKYKIGEFKILNSTIIFTLFVFTFLYFMLYTFSLTSLRKKRNQLKHRTTLTQDHHRRY